MNINKWHIIDHDLMLTVYRTDVCSLCGTWYTCLCSSVFHVVMSCSGICIILHPEARDMAARAQKDRKVGNPCNLSSTPTSNKHTFSGEWGLFLQTRVISRTVSLGREVLLKSSDSCQSERTSSRSVARVMAMSFRMLEGLKISSLQCEL